MQHGKQLLLSLLKNGNLGTDPEILLSLADLCQDNKDVMLTPVTLEPAVLPFDVASLQAIIYRERRQFIEYSSRVLSDRECYLKRVRELEVEVEHWKELVKLHEFDRDYLISKVA